MANVQLANNRVMIIGTSLVQHNAFGGSSLNFWSRGWFTWAQIFGLDIIHDIWQDPSSPSFIGGANQGVSGQTSSEIVARLNKATALNPDLVIIDNGTNETGSDTFEEITANTETIIKAFTNKGTPVIVLPILARALSSWPDGSVQRQMALQVNQWKREYCRQHRNVYFFDWNEHWIDQSNSDGEPKTGYSNDGIHFNVAGAFYVGRALYNYLAQFLPLAQPSISSPDDVYAADNLKGAFNLNPMLLGTGGTDGTGVVGDVPDGHVVDRSGGGGVTATTAITTDDNGKRWCEITFVPGGAAEELFFFRNGPSDSPHTFDGGTFVEGSIDVKVDAYAGYKQISLLAQSRLSGGGSGTAANGNREFNDGGLQSLPNEAWEGTIKTPKMELEADSVGVRFRLEMTIDGAVAGSPKISVSRPALRMCDDPKDVWVPTGTIGSGGSLVGSVVS